MAQKDNDGEIQIPKAHEYLQEQFDLQDQMTEEEYDDYLRSQSEEQYYQNEPEKMINPQLLKERKELEEKYKELNEEIEDSYENLSTEDKKLFEKEKNDIEQRYEKLRNRLYNLIPEKNKKVYELAEEVNLLSSDVIENAKYLNIELKSSRSDVPNDLYDELVEYIQTGRCILLKDMDAIDVIEAMRFWFLKIYEEPVNRLHYESKESGYQGLLIDPSEYLFPYYDNIVEDSSIEKLVNELTKISPEWTPIDITDEEQLPTEIPREIEIKTIPLNRTEPYDEYLQSNITERAFVVYNYTFKGLSHRKLDEDIFGLDSKKSKGFHTMRILHSMGLREEHKNMFFDYDINDVIISIKDDNYNEIIEILKHIRKTNNDFNGIKTPEDSKVLYSEIDSDIGKGTTNKIFDKHSKPILNIKSVAKVFSTYIIKNNSEYTSTIIGIFAKWGRGKTFFYEQLKKDINDKAENIYFCEFQPWKYQKQESAWAYLYEKVLNNYLKNKKTPFSEKIYKRESSIRSKFIKENFLGSLVYGILDFIEPVKFWKIFLLNKSRLGLGKLITGITSIILLFTWIFMPINWKFNAISWIIGVLGITGTILLYKSYSFYMKSKGTVADLISNYGKTKDYSSHLGFQNEIEKELRYLINTYITEEDERLILFIDDLDRCNEKMIIDIMDSLRLVLEDDEINRKLTIITAVDERILLKSIKHKYFNKDDVAENCDISPREYIEKFYLIALKLNHLNDKDKIELVEEYTSVFNKKENQPEIENEENIIKNPLPNIIKKIKKNEALSNEEKSHIKSEERIKKLIKENAISITDNDIIKVNDNFEKINKKLSEEETKKENEELEVLTSAEINYIKELVLKYNIDTPRKINMMIQRYLLFKNFIFEELGYKESNFELYISLIFNVLKEEKLKELISKYNDSKEDEEIELEIDENKFKIDRNRFIVLVKYAEMVSPF